MQLPRLFAALFFSTVFSNAELRAEAADDAVAAVLKLRSEPGYSWDVTTSKAGAAPQPPPRTRHGFMTSAGEMMLEYIWPDGQSVEMVVRPNGAGVAKTSSGWKTKRELSELARATKRGSSEGNWARLAVNSLEPMTPEEELTHLLNDAKSYERTGDTIDAVLTDRGASYWLGSARLIPEATGTLHLRLRDGLIRECRIDAEGDKNMSARIGSDTVHIAFQCEWTFSYSTPPSIPFDAKQKLEAGSSDSGR